MWSAERETVGVVAANGVPYVEIVLTALEAGRTVLVLPSARDAGTRHGVTVERVLTPESRGGAWYGRPFRASRAEAPGLIAHTSGTEGQAKAVVLSHRALADTVDRLNQFMAVDSSILEYVGVPVYHSFGFGRCRAVASAGGHFYVPRAGFNPGEIRQMLDAKAINAISAIPSLWRVVLEHPEVIGRAGRGVRWIEVGSQAMSRTEKERLCELFPKATIVQHYGLTEASRATLLRLDVAEAEAMDSVGRPFGAAQVRVDGEGRIAVRGPHLASGYLTRSGLRKLTDADGWFTTPDLGRIEEGLLYYEGRADDVINRNGVKVQPELVEAKLREILKLESGFAVARRQDPLCGEGILGVYETATGLTSRRFGAAVADALRVLHGPAGNAVVVREIDTIPRTSSGKTRRGELTRWHEAGSAPAVTTDRSSFVAPRTELERRMVALWEEVLERAPIGIRDDFFELGGHSLAAILLVTCIKSRLGRDIPLSRVLERRTVESLAASFDEPGAEEAPSRLVRLRAGSSRLPLVLFPGAGGSSFIYSHLPALLASDRAVYAFQAFEAAGSATPDLTIDTTAASCVEELLQFGPDGPYVLGGYSFGGLLAFEVARRLHDLGRRVPLLVCFDGFAPGFPRLMPLPHRVAAHVRAMWEGDRQARDAYWRHRASNVKMRVLQWLGRPHEGMGDAPFADAEMNLRLRKLWARAVQARNEYHPNAVLPSDLLLIKAEKGQQWVGAEMDDPFYGWGAFVTGNISTMMVPGEHMKLFDRDNWRTIAQALEQHIAYYESRPSGIAPLAECDSDPSTRHFAA